ncbi:MAG: hypothetical protein K0R00_84 [Herbinix sp.]|jgi:hypothetical protein|nr:hypothetical protein [Herbinix sp.]
MFGRKFYWYYVLTDGDGIRCGVAITKSNAFPLSGVVELYKNNFGRTHNVTFFARISKKESEQIKDEKETEFLYDGANVSAKEG